MLAQTQPRLTPEEYLALDRASEFKNEYYDGCMYAMAGASRMHVLIATNLSGELRQALKPRSCQVYGTDLRLRASVGRLYTYPDVSVVCGEAIFAEDQKDTLVNPTVLVEVLSPSTEAHDRGYKSALYRKIDSLQEYALVWQSEPHVEIYRRQPSGDWLLSEASGIDSTCRFGSLDCVIPLSEIYYQIAFDTPIE
jgi:Uma2 family endonuclease